MERKTKREKETETERASIEKELMERHREIWDRKR